LNDVSTSEQKAIENKVNENVKVFNYLESNLSHANNEGVYNKVQKFQYTYSGTMGHTLKSSKEETWM